MTFFRRVTFNLWYLRNPPWDTGIVPPEVNNFIKVTPPGRALDLGCGTGTSSLGLAKAGWTVSGVDYAWRAIEIARRKAREAGLGADFQVAEVTRLPEYFFTEPFDLVLDIGCFHSLSKPEKLTYIRQLEKLLTPGGKWLIYGFFRPEECPIPGRIPDSSETIQLELIKREDGMEKLKRPSAWFWFKKK